MKRLKASGTSKLDPEVLALVMDAKARITKRDNLKEEIEQLMKRIGDRLDLLAAEAAKRLLGIEAGTYIRLRNGDVVQVLEVEYDDGISEHDIRSATDVQEIKIEQRFSARCARVHKGTGKLIEKRGRNWVNKAGEPNYDAIRISIDRDTVIVPADQVVEKRVKSAKSAAVKELSKLPPGELERLMKLAKRKK